MTDTLAAYFAGLFDGEGSVCLRVTKQGSLTRMLTIINAHLGVLELIRDTFGGKVSQRKSRANTDTPVYALQICGDNADRFCATILPFSIIKKRQLDLFIESRELLCPPGNYTRKLTEEQRVARKELEIECRRLKKVYA